MRGCQCRGHLWCDQCRHFAQRAGVGEPPGVPAVSEAVFQAAVVRLAKQHGWLVHTVHDSRRSPEGWPDVTCAKPGRPLLVCELKVPGGVVTIAQQRWLDVLQQVQGVEAARWRPEDMPQVRAILEGDTP